MSASLTLQAGQELAARIGVRRARALVFEDPRSRALRERIERLAPSDATILVTGETGTGKEIVARYLHELSTRARGPFLAVNFAAIPESLIESELFGHVRGAFTGATSDKLGWFEAAEGGTLFLDEIGDLPAHLQVKLLRVLQEREIVKVGSRQAVPVDVRLIAATNVRLDDAVAAGRFRADLYYRLVVARIGIEPLRQRPGDILPLARHFLAHYSARGAAPGADPPVLTLETERRLLEHAWPGNIRELENAIHGATLLCRDGRIRPDDLPITAPASEARDAAGGGPQTGVALVPAPSAGDAEADAGTGLSRARAAFQRALEGLCEEGGPRLWKEIEEAVIRTAYAQAECNQLKTARVLGLTRSIVRARLLEFGALAGPDPAPREESKRDDAPLAAAPVGRVLVIEDDPAIRDSLKHLLGDEGYEVAVAENGDRALQVLAAPSTFDVIVLDLMMPVMDGWRFRAIQRDDPRLRDIPVIAISAFESGDGPALAAAAFLRKPFEGAALLRAVDSTRSGRQSAAASTS